MKRLLLITVLLTSISTTRIFCQNIYSALQHNRDEAVKDKVPIEVIEENIFYNSSGKEVKKNKKETEFKKKSTNRGALQPRWKIRGTVDIYIRLLWHTQFDKKI
jgi:hypothetical protein